MEKIRATKPIYILFIFVALSLVIGIFIVPDYGRSTDESYESRRMQVALSIYTGEISENPIESYEGLGHSRYYGTASTALIAFIEAFVFPNTNHSTKVVAHYSYFIFFQAAVIGIFLLARNFLDDWVSLGVALIFGTQPLLIGHAFINPKDIPILTTFLFTMVAGFAMVDSWREKKPNEGFEEHAISPKKSMGSQKSKKRLVSITFFSLLIILWSSPWITNIFLQIIEYSFTTRGESLLGNIFASVTTSGSLEGYLTLARNAVLEVYRWISFGIPFLLAFLFFYAQKHRLYGKKINLLLLLAASIWGFAVSTRVLSITAGGMIGLYALIKIGRKAVFPLFVYTLTASIISYITWPLLWIYGIKVYIESLTLYNNFPWPGRVLFEGQSYAPTELPARFVPKLMMLQFTEPMVILTLVGLMISLYMLFKRKTDTIKLVFLFTWFFLPLLYIIIGHPTIYSNFRHFLFIIPPLFIFAGFALQFVTSRLKNKALILAICLLICIPGLVSMAQIHPFEYIYYNSFIGGIEGADGEYHLDYWTIAYKNAMDYVNENIPPGSRILVWKNNRSGADYADQDYYFAAHSTVPEEDYQNFDYMIMPTGRQEGHAYFSELPIIFSVDVDGVSLMVVLEIPHEEN